MNYRTIICYDFETTSPSAETTQPVQLAAVAIDPRKLEIIPGSEFESLMKPVLDDDECERLGVDALTDGAIAVHKKTREILANAPETKAVWENFVDYVNRYNYKKTNFTAPISMGFNIDNFDSVIVQRLCSQDPYNFGPVNKKNGKQDVFSSFMSIDMMKNSFILFENNKEVNSLSADNLIRGYMGYEDQGQSHDALSDVIMTAEYYIRYQKMIRNLVAKKNFKGAFKTNGY